MWWNFAYSNGIVPDALNACSSDLTPTTYVHVFELHASRRFWYSPLPHFLRFAEEWPPTLGELPRFPRMRLRRTGGWLCPSRWKSVGVKTLSWSIHPWCGLSRKQKKNLKALKLQKGTNMVYYRNSHSSEWLWEAQKRGPKSDLLTAIQIRTVPFLVLNSHTPANTPHHADDGRPFSVARCRSCRKSLVAETPMGIEGKHNPSVRGLDTTSAQECDPCYNRGPSDTFWLELFLNDGAP